MGYHKYKQVSNKNVASQVGQFKQKYHSNWCELWAQLSSTNPESFGHQLARAAEIQKTFDTSKLSMTTLRQIRKFRERSIR